MRPTPSERIAETLRGELKDGCWPSGATLPSVDRLRVRFGAGEYAVRRTLKQLRDEGLITIRQNVGAVATEMVAQAWKGNIAFVCVGACGSYFDQMLAQQLTWRFEAAGWRTSTIRFAVRHDGSIDLSLLARHLANGLDFVVGRFAREQIAELLDRANVPYVVLNGFTRDFPNARAVIRESGTAGYNELIQALKRRKVRTLLEFDFERMMDRSFKKQLFDANISVRRIMHSFKGIKRFDLGVVREHGYRTVADFFATERNRQNLPDAILFDDDYFAAGGIVALLEAGIRIPEDVGVVSYINSGNELTLGKKITGIGLDPAAYGDAVASYVLELLAGHRVSLPRLSLQFFPGESL